MSNTSVTLFDHSDEVLAALDAAVSKGLEMIGLQAEDYAAMKAPVDTGRRRLFGASPPRVEKTKKMSRDVAKCHCMSHKNSDIIIMSGVHGGIPPTEQKEIGDRKPVRSLFFCAAVPCRIFIMSSHGISL